MLIKEHLHCDLAIDLEGQDHIFFPMIDYVGVHVKISSLVGLPIVKNHYLSAFELCDLDL